MTTKIYETESQSVQVLNQFFHLTRRYALFHISFFALFTVELLALLLFLPFLAKSFLLASLIALTVLTAFSYFVLRFYFQTKKPEQFLKLRDRFMDGFSLENVAHLGKIESIRRLIQQLDGKESHYYALPSYLASLTPLIKKLSVWCHFGDVQLMRELLYTATIETTIGWIKAAPTHVELHRELGHLYRALYQIYQDPRDLGESIYAFMNSEYTSEEMKRKFQKAALRAIEELKIVIAFEPNDHDAYLRLAQIYHDLKQHDDERKTYETVLTTLPDDTDVQFKLGSLYFQQGYIADGLRLYEALKQKEEPKADELIEWYGRSI